MPTTYLSAKQVMAAFGGICEMTLYRWLADETMAFPKPIYIRKRRYFDAAEVGAFKERVALTAMTKPSCKEAA